MGREQGDFLETPVTYVKEINGEMVERPAYMPEDHVNLQASGWRQKSESKGSTKTAAPAQQNSTTAS